MVKQNAEQNGIYGSGVLGGDAKNERRLIS